MDNLQKVANVIRSRMELIQSLIDQCNILVSQLILMIEDAKSEFKITEFLQNEDGSIYLVFCSKLFRLELTIASDKTIVSKVTII